MVRSQGYDKISVKRGVRSPEEDAKIVAFVSKHGPSNWTSVPKKAGLKRCGKSCRFRWTNYLRPDLKQDTFTSQEEDLIIKLHAAIGSRWFIIAQQLPGRTDNDVKNYWNTKLKKKLSQMGIDPVTHKPFSKLIADYGNIEGSYSQKPTNQTSFINNKDLKSSILLNSEPYQTLKPQGVISRITNNNNNNNSQQQTLQMEPITDKTNLSFNSLTDLTMMPTVIGSTDCGIMTENETITSSSSSSCSTPDQDASPVASHFRWNDFLLEDAFVPTADNNDQEMVKAGFLSKELLVCRIENVSRQSWNNKEARSQHEAISNDFQLSSSSSSYETSFVEAMLDQENEMFLNFPHLMEEPSHY
ncbi:hypothetical protein HN51_009174 [Arachis hypogaea]|uniref:Transcription factor n=1 Tax=Arachis hypogaea TaxID=3818 RepID=A0A445D0G7_ARAHY|nr:transcription factor MYB35 [Arachis hypogaea]RYR56662.1 hypothetical protein Ahy_A05g022343 [Arachis hypogaea]